MAKTYRNLDFHAHTSRMLARGHFERGIQRRLAAGTLTKGGAKARLQINRGIKRGGGGGRRRDGHGRFA